MSLEGMIAQAERSLGLSGAPNYITREYAKRHGAAFLKAAWCNMSITYWARHAGEFESVCFDTDYAYTVTHASRFRKEGSWHADVAGIRRGDIVFFDFDGTDDISRIDHVGIVTKVSGGNVYTIEGNTDHKCARRVRKAKDIAGYGRPVYKGTKQAAGLPAFPGADKFVVGAKGRFALMLQTWLHVGNWGPRYRVGPSELMTEMDLQKIKALQRHYLEALGPADGRVGPRTWRYAYEVAKGMRAK